MKKIAGWAAGLALLGYGAVATGQQARSISASDKATGAKAHPQLLAEFGGPYQGSQATYVSQVGKKIAVRSGLSNSQNDFTVTLLNSPVNNAFAIPGGYVYVTRELLALMNDEAELASVLGHEVGHVAARHSAKRQSAAQRNSILGTLGSVLIGAVTGNSQFGQLLQQGAGQAAQLFTLKYSRTQEYEADDLGIRYLAGAGYDPTAAASMLASLAAQTNLDARATGQTAQAMPAWASTHPDPAGRVTRARQTAQKSGAARGVRNRDAFMAAVNGTRYEDDPAQGVVDGQTFRHPQLRLKFTVPQGFAISNGAQAVTVSGSGGQAEFAGGSGGDLRAYVQSVFAKVGGGESGTAAGQIQTSTINGIPVALSTARANTQSGQVDVTVVGYQFSNSANYHFTVITAAGAGLGSFQPMVQSFARLTPAEAAAIKPRRVQVVTVGANDTVATLARRMAYPSLQAERFMVLNALTSSARLTSGQKVKLIVYG